MFGVALLYVPWAYLMHVVISPLGDFGPHGFYPYFFFDPTYKYWFVLVFGTPVIGIFMFLIVTAFHKLRDRLRKEQLSPSHSDNAKLLA
ncbi:hypothetical protein HK098_004871 [Nowakowskiella sp. JEL0407]|nr:hypothetical protein HK098_004871 [Nowakowskiella sp. JEL0407]